MSVKTASGAESPTPGVLAFREGAVVMMQE